VAKRKNLAEMINAGAEAERNTNDVITRTDLVIIKT